MATIEDLDRLDIRCGKIIKVEDVPEAIKPVYKLTIDFGDEIGAKVSCAQVKPNYTKDQLLNKLVIGVVNFPPRKIGPVESQVLTLGLPDEKSQVVLLHPERDVPLGAKLY
jgi:tRNA-binding protein